MKKEYKYAIVGAGIAGSSVAYFLSKYEEDIVLIDKNEDIAKEASGAAGAFLSPLLGKPNTFKDLVTKSLKFSVDFYEKNMPELIDRCGVLRIPKNEEDAKKFESYLDFMDFDYELKGGGCFFEIGSRVQSSEICKELTKNVAKLYSYNITDIKRENDHWILNNEIKTKKLILTTGHDIKLIEEDYFNIRAVWGKRINIKTSNHHTTFNYHKACSVSNSLKLDDNNYMLSLGATHHRFQKEEELKEYLQKDKELNEKLSNKEYEEGIDSDVDELIKNAKDITPLDNIKFIDSIIGARASSVDYFPMVGKIINSQKTLEEFPYMKNGTNVNANRFTRYENLFVINGVGGRGFVLSPYLAKELVEHMVNNKELEENIVVDRLFKRWVKRQK